MVKKKLKLGRVFRKAVLGYKKKVEKEEVSPEVKMVRVPVPVVEEKKVVKRTRKGIPITTGKIMPFVKKPEVDVTKINIKYPLIKSKGKAIAWANIKWSPVDGSLVYYIIEPMLSDDDKKLLEKIKSSIIEKLDIDFSKLRPEKAKEYLTEKFSEMINLLAKGLPREKIEAIQYYVERDFIGLGKIEPLMKDPSIEDISCDGVGIPIYIYHRNPIIGSIKTNISFDKKEELDKFVIKLAQRCGKSISVADPILNASLPDGSRLQATLGTDIALKGSNFTIRKFTVQPLSPVDLIKWKTLDPKIVVYLWMAIDYKRSILIAGGVASGKTTLLNALAMFIDPHLKIVSIEDTPEIKLVHPHWVPSVARQPIAEVGGRKVGEVDLFDLLRESLRQRPDFLIVGEVRGREAYVLFQQIATGHASMSTIHADSMERLVDRLTTPPINLPAGLIESLDIIVFLVRIKYGSSYIRRISNIFEIIGFDRERDIPITNEVFRWDPKTDTYMEVNPSIVMRKISETYGIRENVLKSEISDRLKMIKWAIENNISDYRDFTRIIKIYDTSKEDIMDLI